MKSQISIIIASLGEKVIRRCLESIDNQSIKPYEVMIITDYAGYECVKRISREFEDIRISLKATKREGIGRAWKHAISKISDYGYSLFLGSDDILFTSIALEKLEKTIVNTGYPNSLFCQVEQVRADGTSFLSRAVFDEKRFFCTGNALCHQGVVYKNEVLKKIDFNVDRVFCDYEISYLFFIKSRPKRGGVVLSKMSKTGLSTSWKMRKLMRAEFNEIIRENGFKPSMRARLDQVVVFFLDVVSRIMGERTIKYLEEKLVGRLS